MRRPGIAGAETLGVAAVAAAVAWLGFRAVVPARAADEPAPIEIVLDVGADRDDDPGMPAHLDVTPGLSDRRVEAGRTYRSLDPGASVPVRFSAEALALPASGVPYRHAVVEVDFRDTVDEEDCASLRSTRVYCRPRLTTRLDYGRDRVLEWWPIAGLAGLADDAWKDTSVFLEASPWQTLRAIDGTFQFVLAYPRQLSGGRPLPLDRVVLRFPPEAAFHQLRDAERAERGLVRVAFEEARAPDFADREDLGYVVYVRPVLEKVFPNSVPSRDEVRAAAVGLRLVEVPGEREPGAVSVYALDALRGLTARVTDLTSGDGASAIPAERIALHRVGVLDKRWAFGYDAKYGPNPWVLLDAEPFDAPPGTSVQFWLTVHVPAGTPSGRYTGAVVVSAEGRSPAEVPLAVEVLDVTLEDPVATPYLYHSPYLPGKHFAPTFRTALADMAAHDIHPIVYLDAAIDLDDGHVDLRDLDRELSEMREVGILPGEPRVGISDNARSLYRRLCPGAEDFAEACPDFDEAYRAVLARYRAAFEPYGVVPALSFTDEPGNDPERRVVSNYLHRLARAEGMRTWVTYYPRCEEPLAGHTLRFRDLSGPVEPGTPGWLARDERVKGYWDFAYGPMDRSDYANHGQLSGGARTEHGLLVLPDAAASMRVADADWLDLTTAATVSLWLRPSACPTGYATHPLSKWAGTETANYVLYLFGDYDGRYPDSLGALQAYASAGGRWAAVSGRGRLDCAVDLDRWHHLLWTYDAATGGRLLVDGVPHGGGASGVLATNDAPLVVGRVAGAIDDVLVLDRALSDEELVRVALDRNAAYDTAQSVALTAIVTDTRRVPDRLRLAVHDALPAPAPLETTKSLRVNGAEVWHSREIGDGYPVVDVDVAPFLRAGAPNEIALLVTNGEAREEHLELYFVDEAWRHLEWSVKAAPHWRHESNPDGSGALGPMDPELDDRVYAMRYVTAEEIAKTRAATDTFSYYTTYPATQPALVNNRFLHGIYAAATGAEGVYVYAYGDWGSQPWDDTEPSYVERLGNAAARRSQNNYALVMPAWEDRVYDTLAFEMLREGIEDARVIATLEAAIARHPGPAAREARAHLADLLARPSRAYAERYMFLEPDAPIERYADRGGEMLADLAGRPDDWAFFDRERERMLREILALREAGRTTFLPVVSTR